MVRFLQIAAAALLLSSGSDALASGDKTSAKPPSPPKVDLSTLPKGAALRPDMGDGKRHPGEARLLVAKDGVAPGGKVRVGIHMTQDEHWHTYWKSPGDIGLPIEAVEWTLPEGAEVSAFKFPVPQRFETTEPPLISFGYEDQVLVFGDLLLPKDIKPGKHELGVTASWLICKTACIPGEAELKLRLTVTEPGTESADTPWAPLFDHYAKQHPIDVSETGDFFRVQSHLSSSSVLPNSPFKAAFVIKAADGKKMDKPKDLWPTYTFIQTGYEWMVNEVAIKEYDGGLLVTIDAETFEPDPLPTDDSVGGLFQIKVDGKWYRTEIFTPLPWVATGTEVKASESAVFGDGAPTDAPPEGGGGGGEANPETAAAAAPVVAVSFMSVITNFFWAFVGGLILNVMPCVLPVLTLKLYSLVEQVDIERSEQRMAGMMYTAGILVSFWVLAGAVIALKLVFGMDVGWGFQFQYPPYVAALATIVFVFGLSLFGVFEIPAFGVGAASEHSSKEGPAGYFFTGVFATLLATPCSAPFLGTATAFAFAAPTPVLIGIFSFVGLGLASPFLVIAFVPAAYKLLPKPGAWMDAFKQLLGFSLMATTIWLLWVLIAQVGNDRAIGFVSFLLITAIGSWVFGRWGGVAATGREQLGALVVAMGLCIAGGWYFLDLQMAEAATECDDGSVEEVLVFHDEIPWQPFSEARVEALQGQPIFIDFTADWCVSCQFNERNILETKPVISAMEEHGIVPLKADWTRKDPIIKEWLNRYNRAGVPLYLVLPADPAKEAIALPEVITAPMVIEALASAQ